MTAPLAFLNGSFLPQAQAVLPLHDAGFVMGAVITDLCRTFRHRLFRWGEHLQRFRQSTCLARTPLPASDEEMTRRAEQLVTHNAALLAPDGELALVLFATPGLIGYYGGQAGGLGESEPTFGMHTFPLLFDRLRPFFERGAHLVIPPTRQVPAACVDPRIKQRSRLHWWLADRQVREQEPGALALLLDQEGHVTETASANFLLVKKGAVLSPPRGSILEGISLRVTQELCQSLPISWMERPITLEECLDADEALLTSTSFCLAGVSQINGQTIPWPGPLLRRLQQAWNGKAGLDIVRQILANP
jgi:branched-chain amino acid aminotransferase